MWLAAAALVLLSVSGGLRGTFAAFTASEAIGIDVTTGTVALSHDGDGLLFTSAPLAPGDSASATVRVSYDGSLPAAIALTRASVASTAPGGCAVRDALAVRIVEDRDGDPATAADRSEVADSPLPEASDALALGTFAPGDERSYEVEVRFAPQHGATAADNDNCFQGSAATERFAWQAVEDRS